MEAVGTVRGTRGGFAFLIREDGGEDLLIAAEGLSGAIHGDRVRVNLFARERDFRPIAVVDEVLERKNPHSTGQLIRAGRSFFLRPDSPMLPEQIPVRLGSVTPVAGAKVLFRVETGKDDSLYGLLEEVLGDADDARLDKVVIATEFGLDLRFSDAALNEVEALQPKDLAEEDAKREDFRDQFVVTIDPVDAKDFDDAVSVERKGEDGYSLTVHIADVTSYVPEGSVLDEEALARASSTYFPGSVIPMLPEAISTVAASLTPDSDKRTMTVVMEFDRWGWMTKRRITRGWIRSRARLTYEQAQEVLEGKGSIDPELDEQLRTLHELSRRLRELRFEHGGFELEVPEARIELGPDGVPVNVSSRTHLPAHELIEEFMIAANRAVGSWAHEQKLPFSYRVHLPPEAKSMDDFAGVAMTLLPNTKDSVFESPKHFRRWLAELREHPLGPVVHRFFLRAMQKAVYSEKDRGHFGLGIDGYAHFTSPIRRYSDLFNHRRLKERIDQAKQDLSALTELARTVSDQASLGEQAAEQAEREMIRLKSARYLQTRLGEVLPGRVSGLTHKGLFVSLDLGPVEGFVPRATLPSRMHFDEVRMAFVADRGSWELRPGDKVQILVVNVDLRKRQVEFSIESSPKGKRKLGPKGKPRSGFGHGGPTKGPKGKKGQKGKHASKGRPGTGKGAKSGSSSRAGGPRKRKGASGRSRSRH